jgi:hypothetical protein
MTDAPKFGRPTSPCKHCGESDRDHQRNCIPCRRAYMAKYLKKWRKKRKQKMQKGTP